MGYRVTSLRRQLVMAALLTLATAGAVVRHYAPEPSTLRDIGTLLLVLWLPAVGNLVGFVLRKIPRSAPPPTDFAAGTPFMPHLRVRMEPVAVDAAVRASIDPAQVRCTLVAGRRGFTARLPHPLAGILADGAQTVAVELLRPDAAQGHLATDTVVHVLHGTTAVATGRVLAPKQAG